MIYFINILYFLHDVHRFPHLFSPTERQLEDATRGERTVMVTNVNLKAVEKDVYDFFRAAGPIRDIQLIKDSRSGRSKGVAYVEFFQQEDVANACQLSGQILMLQPVRVQHQRCVESFLIYDWSDIEPTIAVDQ